ncbi:MAG: hypothetical protein ABL866_00510 [Devosia sp.]
MRLRTLALLGLLAATPASAVSLTSSQVGEIYCAGRLSGDMAPVLAILSPELAELVGKALPGGVDAATAIQWQGESDYANTCQAVGASGTFESPEVIIAFGYRDPAKAGYADSLVLRFIDKRLRIDDIRFGTKGTLRERLANP